MNTRDMKALGIPGIAGLGLLLFCASFHFGTIAPMRTQLDSVQSEARRLAATLRATGLNRTSTVPTETQEALSSSRPASDPVEIIRRLNAVAESSAVTVDRASYTTTEKEGLTRIEVSLPTKGGYLPIRVYLHEALKIGRDAQIDSLVLQRARATDPVLDADLKLSFQLDPK
ncbi:MAG: hypothetical protein ABIK82_03315 [Pseudomonadota bacterium]